MRALFGRFFLPAKHLFTSVTMRRITLLFTVSKILLRGEKQLGRLLQAPAREGRIYAAAERYSACFFTWATGFSFSSNSVACT